MIRKLFSKIKLQYKRMSYELSNVDLQSQEAFDLVRRGAPRPRVLGSPVIYDVQLRAFNPPKFTISVQITGETDYFLRFVVTNKINFIKARTKLRKNGLRASRLLHMYTEKSRSIPLCFLDFSCQKKFCGPISKEQKNPLKVFY